MAKRLAETSGQSLAGHFVHYVICKVTNKAEGIEGDQTNNQPANQLLAERAFHAKEFTDDQAREDRRLQIDIDYYKSQ